MDIHEVAETIAAAGGGGGVRFRQGTVVSVQSDGTITATIAGSTISVTGIKCWASVVPQPGHGVWLATDGVDLIAVGTVGGPSTFAGEVKMFAGVAASAPPGWLALDGSAVSRATYTALFSAIGTTYGPVTARRRSTCRTSAIASRSAGARRMLPAPRAARRRTS